MIEVAVRAKLLAASAVSNLVSTRIYPLMAPQNVVAPFVVYQRISVVRYRGLSGPTRTAQPRIQIDSYAADWKGAHELAGAIRQALDGFKGDVPYGDASPQETLRIKACSLQTDRDFLDETVQPVLYRVSADYFVMFDES